jgi:energy-coupling factor transport system ATP-binding protein
MKLDLENVAMKRGSWSLAAQGMFPEGVHLVSGDVGSGKSTLALLMAGLFPPCSGSVVRHQISSVMISFQYPEYHVTGMTIAEECESWGLDPAVILPTVGLDQRSGLDPLQLSRGELKRLHLACLLAHQYDLLILDEPFSSLDVSEKQRICDIISHRTSGITVLFTHEQAIFPRVAHIWEILEGRLVYCGTPPKGLSCWHHAPAIIQSLIADGKIPKNLSHEDLMEAACRM